MRTAVLLIALLALGARGARAVTGTDAQKLSVIATLGSEAAHKTAELERAAAGAPAEPRRPFDEGERRCRAEFSMPDLLRRLDAGELGRADKVVEVMFEDAERYYECEAYALNRPDECANLKWFQQDMGPGAHNREDLCREIYRKLTLSKAVIDGEPDAAKICEGLYLTITEKDDQVIREGTIPETCAIIATDKDPESVCAKRSRLSIRPFNERQMKECVFFQGVRTGSPKYCALLPGKEKYCRAFVDYKRAHEAGKPELCAGATDCRLLMGEGPKTCEASADNLKTYYCRDRAQKESAAAGDGGLPALRAAAKAAAAGQARWQALLDAFPDKNLPGYREELARRAREGARLDAVRKKIEAMKSP